MGRDKSIASIVCAMLLSAAACGQDASGSSTSGSGIDIPIRPGPDVNLSGEAAQANPYEGDENAIREGQRLYDWYNCSGCHAPKGGGGMGPPLSTGNWIYGGEPASLFQSIWEGRPDGMPAWAGRIPKDATWKLVAYIQTLPDAGPKDEPAFAPQDQ